MGLRLKNFNGPGTRLPIGQVRKARPKSTVVTLKMVAQRVGLTPGTVSAVLNDAPSSRSIPQATKDRIHSAATELDYQPNFLARSLRNKRTYTIGVIAEEIGDSYGSLVISGIEKYLRGKDYFFLTVVHRHDPELLKRYSQLLVQRGVEGFITVDVQLTGPFSLPTVAVPGHKIFPGVTNIVLDHQHAARVALSHLVELGHVDIAFMKGQAFSSDSEDRWQAICQVAEELRIKIRPELCVQIDIDDPTPQVGYPFARQLLERGIPFTALFAYNDISALGAIRAFQEAGRSVPKDISVVGFDDIQGAAYSVPGLTTVRQPLVDMGSLAARTLVERIEGDSSSPPQISIEPQLVVRSSTAQAARTVTVMP
jgi:DNA-binding LacI/PurR family transcriptional regulator